MCRKDRPKIETIYFLDLSLKYFHSKKINASRSGPQYVTLCVHTPKT